MILNLLDRMKLPFRKDREFLSALHEILGFYPHNIEIYRIAFSHKSLSYQRPAAPAREDRRGRRQPRGENTSRPLNNERLEFLGDAVLETVVSDIVFHHFDHKREGFLTATRSKIVQRESLNRLSAQMGLDRLVRAAQGTRMTHTNIGGNAFEALMGAIYLDRGFKYCHWFIKNRVVGAFVDLDGTAKKEVNFKSKLLEWSQKNRINNSFRDAAIGGDKGFRTVIVIEGIPLGKGTGRTKKESQQLAAKDALMRMRKDAKVYDSIFRAKEKRTAMEADESFALPKIDEIEDELRGKQSSQRPRPVLEEKKDGKDSPALLSDDAYATAYAEGADYEVIDTPADDLPDYSASADAESDAEAKPKRRRSRGRGAKTVTDAVKGMAMPAAPAAEAKEGKSADAKQGKARSSAKNGQKKDADAAASSEKETDGKPEGEKRSRSSRRRSRKSAEARKGEGLPALPALDSDEGVVMPAPVAEPIADASNEKPQAETPAALAGILEAVREKAENVTPAPAKAEAKNAEPVAAPSADTSAEDTPKPAGKPAAVSEKTDAEPKASAQGIRRLSLDEVVFGAVSVSEEQWSDDSAADIAADSADGDAPAAEKKPRRRGGRRRGGKRAAGKESAENESGSAADAPAAADNASYGDEREARSAEGASHSAVDSSKGADNAPSAPVASADAPHTEE